MKKNLMYLVLLLVVISIYYFFIAPYVTVAALKQSRDMLQAFVEERYAFSVTLYMGLYTLGVTLSLPVAAVFTLAGGFLFGAIRGMLYALISATMGATGAFLLVRYLVGDWVQERYAEQLAGLNERLNKRGVYYLVALRFFAVIPFFVLNIVAGLTKVSLRDFIVTTIIGILPGSFVFAYAGQNLGTIETPSDIMTPQVLGAFGLLGLLALVPLFFKKERTL